MRRRHVGTATLSNARTIYSLDGRRRRGGASTKVPTLLPDSASVVFEETHDKYPPYNYMLPDYAASPRSAPGSTASWRCSRDGGRRIRTRRVTHANTGVDPAPTVNYEPKPLPVSVGGYYWVVFASRRQDAYPSVATPKKLWVTAISPGGTPGVDPSHPPFTLVNQAIVAPSGRSAPTGRSLPASGPGRAADGERLLQRELHPGRVEHRLVCGEPPMAAWPVGGRCAAGESQGCCGASKASHASGR